MPRLGHEPATRSGIDLREVVLDCLTSVHEHLDSGKINVELDLGDNLPRVSVDPGEIGTVLRSLLLNSMQAMSAGGMMSICLAADEQRVCTRVADKGWGVPLDAVACMFGRQEALPRNVSIEGARIYQILDRYCGALDVERHPGKGSVTTLSLPVAHAIESAL